MDSKFNEDFKEIFYYLNYDRDHPDKDKTYDNYSYENITFVMFSNKMKSERVDLNLISLPRDIVKVYWYRKGKNDEVDWNFVAKIKYTAPQKQQKYKYVYFVASCDYTGFDCRGVMRMYISKSLKKILDLAIDPDVIDLMKKESAPIKY